MLQGACETGDFGPIRFSGEVRSSEQEDEMLIRSEGKEGGNWMSKWPKTGGFSALLQQQPFPCQSSVWCVRSQGFYSFQGQKVWPSHEATVGIQDKFEDFPFKINAQNGSTLTCKHHYPLRPSVNPWAVPSFLLEPHRVKAPSQTIIWAFPQRCCPHSPSWPKWGSHSSCVMSGHFSNESSWERPRRQWKETHLLLMAFLSAKSCMVPGMGGASRITSFNFRGITCSATPWAATGNPARYNLVCFIAPAAVWKTNIKLKVWEQLHLTIRHYPRNNSFHSAVPDKNPVISGSHPLTQALKNAVTKCT